MRSIKNDIFEAIGIAPRLPVSPRRYWNRNKLEPPGSPRHKHYRENARRLKQMERQA